MVQTFFSEVVPLLCEGERVGAPMQQNRRGGRGYPPSMLKEGGPPPWSAIFPYTVYRRESTENGDRMCGIRGGWVPLPGPEGRGGRGGTSILRAGGVTPLPIFFNQGSTENIKSKSG